MVLWPMCFSEEFHDDDLLPLQPQVARTHL